jgi:hypothetical protein
MTVRALLQGSMIMFIVTALNKEERKTQEGRKGRKCRYKRKREERQET